jgi:hypothetical protein
LYNGKLAIMKRLIVALVYAGLSTTAARASAQQWQGSYTPAMPQRASDVDNIGNAGQIVFGVERVTGVFFDRDKTDWQAGGVDREETQSTTTFGLFGMNSAPSIGGPTPSSVPRLALDYLVTDGFSLGGSLAFVSHSADLDSVDGGNESSTDAGTLTMFYVNPRLGYAFPFDETFGLWPRLGVAFASRNVEDSDAAGVTFERTVTNWQLTVDAMLIVSPFSHFAILAGPYLDLGLGGSYESTLGPVTDERNANLLSFGLSIAIVGYY